MCNGEFKTVQNDLLVWKVENNMGWKEPHLHYASTLSFNIVVGENKEILENKADLETIIDFTGADDWTKRQSASSSGRAEKVQGDPWGLAKEAPTTQGEVWES